MPMKMLTEKIMELLIRNILLFYQSTSFQSFKNFSLLKGYLCQMEGWNSSIYIPLQINKYGAKPFLLIPLKGNAHKKGSPKYLAQTNNTKHN